MLNRIDSQFLLHVRTLTLRKALSSCDQTPLISLKLLHGRRKKKGRDLLLPARVCSSTVKQALFWVLIS